MLRIVCIVSAIFYLLMRYLFACLYYMGTRKVRIGDVLGRNHQNNSYIEATVYSQKFDSVEIYLWAMCYAFLLHHSACKALCSELV